MLRNNLIDLVEKTMERDALKESREVNLPQIERAKEEAEILRKL